MQKIDIRDNTELYDVARLFYGDDVPVAYLSKVGEIYCVEIADKRYEFDGSSDKYSAIFNNREGRLSKIALYDALSRHTGHKMPWGALTGVRPSKLFYECLAAGKSAGEATDIMRDVYRVDDARACILRRIIYAQKNKIYFSHDYINLYIHIPYCTTRCSYCSFVSAPISKNIAQSKRYVELLCDEISRSVALLGEYGKKILSVYIGGGTPTALDAEDIDKLLSAVAVGECEYTCEAGRPDTIDERKADILLKHGVNRVCVNPQTLCDETLVKIGRRHSSEDFFRAYDIVKSRGFDVNCDLIAGLADETPADFARSFEGIKNLQPENITVHSLSQKNGSEIRYDENINGTAPEMIDYALSDLGAYRPYYLYRQKRQAGNLENIGFSLPGKECVNNITTMEETVGVMACGAGAISKYVGGGNIARFANLRDIGLYIERYEEKLQAKNAFFAECFSSHKES